MYVMDHMKQGSDLHIFVDVLVFFPCYVFLVLFQHVFASRHKADIVRKIIPGLRNMSRKKQMSEGEIFSGLHVQVILFSSSPTEARRSFLTFCMEILLEI